MKSAVFLATVVLGVVSLAIYGCGSPSNHTEQPPNPSADTSDGHGGHSEHDGHSDHSHSDHGQTDMEKMRTELAKLSPEDAASAQKQHLCPVSGEMLGTMGAPKKIEVNGQQVWICCDGCKDKLLEHPDEYLAKLQNE